MTDHNLTLNDLFFLPILFIGFLILGVCFAFCCYLLRTMRDDYDIDAESPRRIRYDGLRRGNYRKKWLKKVSLKSDTCAICLDDFQHKEEISICRCGHAYHHKCIMKWMEIKETCPICQRNCRHENNNGGERTPLLTNPLDIWMDWLPCLSNVMSTTSQSHPAATQQAPKLNVSDIGKWLLLVTLRLTWLTMWMWSLTVIFPRVSIS